VRDEIDEMVILRLFVEKYLKSDVPKHPRMVYFVACALHVLYHGIVHLLGRIQGPEANVFRIVFSKTAEDGCDTVGLNFAENAESDAMVEHALNVALLFFEKGDKLIPVHQRAVRQVYFLHQDGLDYLGYLLDIFFLKEGLLFCLFYYLQGFGLEQGETATEGGIRQFQYPFIAGFVGEDQFHKISKEIVLVSIANGQADGGGYFQ